jgi:hypothetical protein
MTLENCGHMKKQIKFRETDDKFQLLTLETGVAESNSGNISGPGRYLAVESDCQALRPKQKNLNNF